MKLTKQPGKAVLYYRTKLDRVSAQELDQVHELLAFARSQGWVVEGAVIEPKSATPRERGYSRLWEQIQEDWDCDKLTAVITWDAELGKPDIWEDELPEF
ncbi:hypothetical protein [Streptomyces sp. NPDC051546]|uniref:hypothetical protein n=1 Tax=Streptomyces sp. NPDC051546 TaxID=3365655 RepID=UPI0037A70E4F